MLDLHTWTEPVPGGGVPYTGVPLEKSVLLGYNGGIGASWHAFDEIHPRRVHLRTGGSGDMLGRPHIRPLSGKKVPFFQGVSQGPTGAYPQTP
jgi:hypothetical protein